MNMALKLAITATGEKQHVIARRARISEVRLSHIVTERRKPSAKERERISKVLHLSEQDLFPEAVAS